MKQMTTKQNIIFILVIAISVYISMQIVHAQAVFEPSDIVNCTVYNSTTTVILKPLDECGFPKETLDHYISNGYLIKAVDNGQIFLERIK
jgi:hypothetical protein